MNDMNIGATLLEYFQADMGSLILALVFFLWVVWRYEPRIRSIEENAAGMRHDLNEVRSDLNVVKDDLNVVKNDLNTVKDDLNAVKDDLNVVKSDLNVVKKHVAILVGMRVSDSKSPIKLTDLGKRLSKSTNAQSIAEKHRDKVEINAGDTAYAIQEKCYQFADVKLVKLLEADELRAIDDVAYTVGINREKLMKEVFGLVMRDIVLAECGKSAEGTGD